MIYSSDGSTICGEWTGSLYDTVVKAMELGTEYLALYEAILHYSAAAQTFFDYNTDNLADEGLEASQVDVTEVREDESDLSGTNTELVYGTSCVLNSTPQMKIYFTDNTKTVLINGEAVELQASLTKGYYYYIMDVTPSAIFDTIRIEVKDGDMVLATAKDSVASYCTRLYATRDEDRMKLADAILAYGMAAKALES